MTAYFNARCYCGLNDYSIGLKTANFPMTTNLCHCSSCRHATGQMCINDILIVGVPLKAGSNDDNQEPASLDGLLAYVSSARGTRYSCKRCFAHFFFLERGELWWVFTGLLEPGVWQANRPGGKVLNIVEHIFIESTLDGGIADHLREFGGRKMKRWLEHGVDEVGFRWKDEELKQRQEERHRSQEDGHKEDVLPLYCVCKTISLKFTRPSAADVRAHDRVVPGTTPSDPVKFRAFHCVCRSCRLTSGSHIISWTTVPPRYILDATTSSPIILDQPEGRPSGLVQYESTPGTYREACGTCGASVLFWTKKEGKECVDVNVGLIDEETDGARAERWLSWDKEVGFKDGAVVPGLVEGLEKGVEATQQELRLENAPLR